MRAILFIFLVMAIGCSPCRHISTATSDSTRVEVRTHIERIPDTVFFEIPVEAERHTVRDTTSHLETSYAVSDARITGDGSLVHSLANKPQKRPIATEKEVIYKDSIVYRDHAQTEVVEVERELTKWQKIQMRGFWIMVAALLLIYGQSLWRITKKIF